MSGGPLSLPVLGAAAVVTGPVLWDGLVTGEMPLTVALTRFAVAVAVMWLAITVVQHVFWASSAPRPQPVEEDSRGVSQSSDD